MKYTLLISILLQSNLWAYEFVISPGADADSLTFNKPTNFITEMTSSGGWMRTDMNGVSPRGLTIHLNVDRLQTDDGVPRASDLDAFCRALRQGTGNEAARTGANPLPR